ncbi:uncharacterized protein LOC124483717 isoform X1 [Hypomesus transpacificus]|uniref:uncharacterized protein LOC124483717 isoform X1 n=1 Tax=Hypomesus transpacificus TaxID=137520 RepID=UPI001F085A07|nr:uncharacterized protein LOC124483717 isoform X1 [Hypomesus transpacificus]
MKDTFYSDEHMIIIIPLGSLKDAQEGQLMPENFHCVFKDVYKVFLKGQPKALGMAQFIAGVFILILGLLTQNQDDLLYTVPSVLFFLSGMLSYVAGQSPNMCVTKLSFSVNITSFFWSIVAFTLRAHHVSFATDLEAVEKGIHIIIAALLIIEMFVAMVLIYWESKAVCRQHFNILPLLTLKQMGN